jgi:hypothetical protein
MIITDVRYVVKATSLEGTEHWICPVATGGVRTFGPRDAAEVFAARLDAYTAVDSLPSVLSGRGVAFAIELAGSDVSLMPSLV